MKHLLLAMVLMVSTSAFAGSEIRSASGSSCESSDFQPWELSAGLDDGNRDNNNHYYDNSGGYDSTSDETQVNLKVSYKFGGAKPVDCNAFARKVEREQEAYTTQLELKVRQLEAQLDKRQQVSAAKVKFK